MKITKTLCCLLLMGASYTPLMAQEKTEVKKQETTEEKKLSPEEQAWRAYMAPGKMHELLAKSSGMWTEEVTIWMAPGAPPQKMNATSSYRMLMGGRYQQGNMRGSFDGMPFEGLSVVGYDNSKKVFESTWIDNMGTGIMKLEGVYNEEKKSMEMKGKMVDPMSGKEINVRQTIKFVDDKNQLWEMYQTPANGKEFKSMEIKSVRKEMDKQPRTPAPNSSAPMQMNQSPVDQKK